MQPTLYKSATTLIGGTEMIHGELFVTEVEGTICWSQSQDFMSEVKGNQSLVFSQIGTLQPSVCECLLVKMLAQSANDSSHTRRPEQTVAEQPAQRLRNASGARCQAGCIDSSQPFKLDEDRCEVHLLSRATLMQRRGEVSGTNAGESC